MKRSSLLLAVLTAALVVGCKAPPEPEPPPPPPPPPPPRAEVVRLNLVEGRIDRIEHETVAVFTGEIVEFTCNCPAGARFLVKDLKHLGPLGEVANAVLAKEAPGTAADAASFAELRGDDRRAAVEGLLNSIPDEALAGPAAPADQQSMPDKTAAREQAPGPSGRNPDLDDAFGIAWQGKLTDGGAVIRSEPYRKVEGDQVYKFTWVVEIDGKQQVWDPHIAGMERGG